MIPALKDGKEILVVDDNPKDVLLVQEVLRDARLQLHLASAGNGREAMALLQKGELVPDLILTDLRMPLMDGLELVERVRSDFPAIPIILMTAFGNEQVAMQALRKGAASYVPKKRLDEVLVETVEKPVSVVVELAEQPPNVAVLSHSEPFQQRPIVDSNPQPDANYLRSAGN